MPLTSQGVLFNTLFIVQTTDATERKDGPLSLIAEKFAQIARTVDNANPDVSLMLWLNKILAFRLTEHFSLIHIFYRLVWMQ